MQRSITGFFQDEEGQWVARLDCLHNQHTRHQPPFTERAWVTSEAGRRRAIGVKLDCVRCDRMELPEGLQRRRRTPEWNEQSVPDALRSKHQTKAGVWGVIRVLEGEVLYTVLGPGGAGEAQGGAAGATDKAGKASGADETRSDAGDSGNAGEAVGADDAGKAGGAGEAQGGAVGTTDNAGKADGAGEAQSGAGEAADNANDSGNADAAAQPRVFRLRPDTPGIVVPELPHFVTPQPGARFCVEFYDAAGK